MTKIYKILSREEWLKAFEAGAFAGSAVDLKDGYIHFSTGAQVRETAQRHFAGINNLVVLEVDAAALGAALKWEPSRGGALFPHLYATLRPSDVIAVYDAPSGADGTPDIPVSLDPG